jgi:hypothetical protein
MLNKSRLWLTLACLPLGSAAMAQPPAGDAAGPMTPPKPAPEFEGFMKAVAGNWKCETTMPAGSMGPGSPEMKNKSTIKIKKTLDGFGYDGEWASGTTKGMPAMKGRFFLAWDSAGKQLVNATFDSMGGTTYATGPISGDTATLIGNGSAMGQPMKVRETLTRSANGKTLIHAFDMDVGQGWQSLVKDECRK